MELNKTQKAFLVLTLASVLFVPVYYLLTFHSALKCADYLESVGINVVVGDISSPSLILDVEFPVLLLIADATNATIYRDGFTFYVFDSTMLTAYRYQPKIGFRYDWVRMGG